MASTNEASAIAEECIMNVKTVAACNGQESMVQVKMGPVVISLAISQFS